MILLKRVILKMVVFSKGTDINLEVPVAARSEAWVCGRSLADIMGSNPTRGHGYLSVVSVFCVVS